MVEYNLYHDNWTTAFQPDRGLACLEEPDREDAKWLRNPKVEHWHIENRLRSINAGFTDLCIEI